MVPAQQPGEGRRSHGGNCGIRRPARSLGGSPWLVVLVLLLVEGAVSVVRRASPHPLGFLGVPGRAWSRTPACRPSRFTPFVSLTGSTFVQQPTNHTGLTMGSVAIQTPPEKVRVVPPPASLPRLTGEELMMLRMGERIQKQVRNGCFGNGFVVVDVKGDPSQVWKTLLDFDSYDSIVPTIRAVQVTSRFRNLTKGIFTLSKFRFKLSVVHRYIPEKNMLEFFLDPDTDQYSNILETAEGFWYLDENPEGRPAGWTRVYMMAKVKVNSLVPMWLVEYAADRALTRATAWLKPHIEQRLY